MLDYFLGLSTCCARTTMAPLERLKILLQANNRHYKGMKVLTAFRAIYRNEGLLAYFKGNGAMMLRTFPYGAVQFLSYEHYSKVLQTSSPAINKLVAGSLAGMTACACTYPLDMVRSRLAFQVAQDQGYTTITQTIRCISVKEGGPKALYKGFVPTLLTIVPAMGIGFYMFETMKAYFLETRIAFTNTNPDTLCPELSIIGGFVCGGVAGAVSQTIAYPLDVVRRRMQLAGAVPDGHKYNTCINTLVNVYKDDGIRRGLYRGLSINYLRVCPQVAIMFGVYEVTKQFLNRQ
ncbi:predicted protein [Nematostella vectensis]|uniref:Uncharacterized protein n=1 Tax=Nematostella vectensis TaxID=45351 RepID=A7SZ11_NEMVE|nr:predicted protein [Nematostella vectensis]|eukprot:XP_001623158.1 predicted protein [Nematostella vectensis]